MIYDKLQFSDFIQQERFDLNSYLAYLFLEFELSMSIVKVLRGFKEKNRNIKRGEGSK